MGRTPGWLMTAQPAPPTAATITAVPSKARSARTTGWRLRRGSTARDRGVKSVDKAMACVG